MDAESRAVAERLRDALTARGVGATALLGMRVMDCDDGSTGTLVIGNNNAPIVQWDSGGDSAPDYCDALPDFAAPATWGVLLGLLAEASGGQGVALEYDPSDGRWTARLLPATDDDPIVMPGAGRSAGLALARALLAAWGCA